MKITAVAVGTRGDVNPLVELGSEMVKRGHDFRILAQEGMPMLSNLLMGKWRKKNGIPKVKSFDHYTEQNGRKVLTFYPVSPILMPVDPKWGSQIHVTGYWYHPEEDAAGYEAGADRRRIEGNRNQSGCSGIPDTGEEEYGEATLRR